MKLVIRRDIYTRPAKIMFLYIMIMPILYMYSIFDVTSRNPFLFCLFCRNVKRQKGDNRLKISRLIARNYICNS